MAGIFGRKRRTAWKELCTHIDADFVIGKIGKSDRIEAYYKKWFILYDIFVVDKVTYTRIRAPFVKWDDFEFRIITENFFHRIGKKMGMQDVIVGHPKFDKNFVIKGNDERKLEMLFAHAEIRRLLNAMDPVLFELKTEAGMFQKKFPPNVRELYFHQPGIITNVLSLENLYHLFAETLEHLCQIGTAYEDDPNFFYK